MSDTGSVPPHLGHTGPATLCPVTDLLPGRTATSRREADRWAGLALAVVLAASLAHQVLYSTLAEDAYISLRYSAQLLAGNGLVFNPGEYVEGYSNFLWVLLVAAGGLVHDNLVDVARALAVASTLVAVALTALLVRRVSGSAWAGVAAAAVVASSASVAAYGPSALETPLFAALLLAVLLAVVADRPLAAGLLVAAATMTRPDGAVVAIVVLGWLLARREWRSARALFVAAAVPGAIWTVWRVTYYGHLLPNPIAAKSGGALSAQLASGWAYATGFAAASWPLLLATGIGLVLAVRDVRTRPVVALLAAVTVVYGGFFVAAGGDWMPAWRFFAPIVPLLAAIIGLGISTLRSPGTRGAAAFVVAAVCGASVLTSITHPSTLSLVREWERQVRDLSSTGAWLNRTLPSGTVIATYANGALSYEARDLVVVDLLGLTDEHIARDGQRDPNAMVGHAAQDYPYVLNIRRPEVIAVNGGGWYSAPTCDAPTVLGGYVPALFQPAPDRWMVVYLRPDRAEQLRALLADGQFVPRDC